MRTLTQQATDVRDGVRSPIELVEESLTAIERTQPTINAFTQVFADQARARASELEGAEPVGPLHGVPIAVKDLYDMAGVPTTGCCAAYEHIATADSTVVARLRAAGAIIVGKTNQHELALGTTSQLSSFGPVRNPWNTACNPGGSSGGSGAAVAAGAVAMAMGSDTGGSVRIPASFCGTTGLKVTHGAVSLHGLMPLAPSLDTAGPLAVSAEDCALVFDVISGHDAADPWSRTGIGPPPTGRIAIATRWMAVVTPEARAAIGDVARALTNAGFTIDEIEGPDPTGMRDRASPVLLAEAGYHFFDIVQSPLVTPETRSLLQFGDMLTSSNYIAARDVALELRRQMELALVGYDALLVPSTPYPAPDLGAAHVQIDGTPVATDAIGNTYYTLPVNLSGLPAISFPTGSSPEGLPLSAQLIGPAWSERRLCEIATMYQATTDWHLRSPA